MKAEEWEPWLQSQREKHGEIQKLVEAFVFDPEQVIHVSQKKLQRTPTLFHGKAIQVAAEWVYLQEHSVILGAWASNHSSQILPHGRHSVVASGLWLFPCRREEPGQAPQFGHMGAYWGNFRVYALEIRSRPARH